MSSRRLVVAAVVASVGLAAFVSAQPGAGERPSQPGSSPPGGPAVNRQPRTVRAGEAQSESLERLMKSLGRGLRTLKKQAENPAMRKENLQILADMQRAAVITKGMRPEHVPETDQEAYLDDYRLRQIELIGLLLRAEKSLVKGEYADAARAVAEVEALRNEAHKKFAPDDEEEEAGEGAGNGASGAK